ncbi:MAG: hypothetical protein IR160_03420 [Salinibacterium sp.]|nr:hypothetical protein [Salinibacterium sp.]MBF0671616.1 hypothetical protein [Salinibacterium sp.]
MDTVIFFGYTAAYLALLVWGCVLLARRGRVDASAIPLLVIAGLVYDNTVIASGKWIGEGPLLEALSFGRFWIHAIVTPLLVVWAWDACRRAGARWAATLAAAIVAIVFAVALMVLEYVTVLAGLQIEAGEEYGVLSYGNAEAASGPPLMVLFVAAALLIAGIVVWVKQKSPVLTIGTVLMIIGSAVSIPVESGAVTNAFELVLLTSIVWTTARQDALERRR